MSMNLELVLTDHRSDAMKSGAAAGTVSTSGSRGLNNRCRSEAVDVGTRASCQLELMPTRASQVSQSLQDLFRPAAVEDLLDGAELEQRLQDEGRLEGILTDPELMPNWEVQLQMQQAA